MEALELKNFYSEKRVFVTGHTGFKGSWLCILLDLLGAKVAGYALQPPTKPNLYQLAEVDSFCRSAIADVRDAKRLAMELAAVEPEIVIHMAAQSLVRESYQNPLETFETNLMGTVNLLEAVRKCPSVRAVIIVTTDKVYENRERCAGYRETEALGGFDPYSSSKACAELASAAYRNSFFPDHDYVNHQVAIATARAGNVIGGGDWADERLIPDCVRALLDSKSIELRNPASVRPWQHVFEPLVGYLMLAERLYSDGNEFSGAWNFGPGASEDWPVEKVVKMFCRLWGEDARYQVLNLTNQPHEAGYLRLDSAKAMTRLGWAPGWDLETALVNVVSWSKGYRDGTNISDLCRQQLNEYFHLSGD